MKNHFYKNQLEIRNRLVEVCFAKGINCEGYSLEISLSDSCRITEFLNSLPAKTTPDAIIDTFAEVFPKVDHNTFIFKIEYCTSSKSLQIYTVTLQGSNARGPEYNILCEDDYMPKRFKTAPNYISSRVLIDLLAKVR